jgi:ribonuclease P protein component
METIKKNREFRVIYNTAKSIADRNLVLYYKPNGREQTRFGISISAKVGGSVTRNKIKRRIKEILRGNNERISEGYDIIFIVRVKCANADFGQIKKSVRYLLNKANLLSAPSEFQ